MKFGETFMDYLQGNQERFFDKSSHVEYKRLKKVLKSCRSCRGLTDSCPRAGQDDKGNQTQSQEYCQCEACPLCDQIFFSELMKEASEIAGFFSSRVRHLLHLHIATGMQRYMTCLRRCFKDDHQAMVQEGQMLIEYVTMNAVALRKILKKYDKVHTSVQGRKFQSKMRAKHVEILQSPWLIELGAFYMNSIEPDGVVPNVFSSSFSCDLNAADPIITLMLPDSVTLEYNMSCAICLDLVFNPYALSCGHIFCKLCACSAASVMIFQGFKAANPESKCPVCREVGVYGDAVHMTELDLLLKNRCKEYWKERLVAERAEMVKQSKVYWEIQTKYVVGY